MTLETGKSTADTIFDDMLMPGTVYSGQAMPTIFARDKDGAVIFLKTILEDAESVKNITINFKRRPGDLLKRNASVWYAGDSLELLDFRNSVIDFTNAIFSDRNYANDLKSAVEDSDEIVFCVGYPTNWTELDIATYELILKNSILGAGKYEGKKSSLILVAESKAAFLYFKKRGAFPKLAKGSGLLLIDVGSFMVDITAMTPTSHYQYNGSNHYIGTRIIDFMIKNWYLENIKQQSALWAMYQSLVNTNSKTSNILMSSCRVAREQLCSSLSGCLLFILVCFLV